MEYSSNKLAKMSGVSARTLRHYDDIGLLKPARVASSGYRVYGQEQVSALQQILFYKELGFALADIKRLLAAPGFDRERAFLSHLAELCKKRERLDTLIGNVSKSIAAMKGETTMADKEKFEGFKQDIIAHIDANEAQYGEEIRAKYGDETVDNFNAKMKGTTKEQYDEVGRLSDEFNDALKAAFEQGNPAGELAQSACDLHRRWLCYFWDTYTPQMHLNVVQMYVDDPRFTEYYDKVAPGSAEFLREAINIYCK